MKISATAAESQFYYYGRGNNKPSMPTVGTYVIIDNPKFEKISELMIAVQAILTLVLISYWSYRKYVVRTTYYVSRNRYVYISQTCPPSDDQVQPIMSVHVVKAQYSLPPTCLLDLPTYLAYLTSSPGQLCQCPPPFVCKVRTCLSVSSS